MNLNTRADRQQTYDAIVVGTGISGGWAAKELCEKGLNTLVLERGRMVRHLIDYPTMHAHPWELPYADRLTPKEIEEDYPVQSKTAYAVKQSTKHFFIKDHEQPYIQKKPFVWMRGNQVGGKSLTWGRWSYRWSDYDFEAPAKDGVGIDWPIRYRDIEPWYDYVESYIGVSGNRDGLPQVPDGKFLPPFEMSCLERHVRDKIAERYSDRVLTIGRTSSISVAHNGRGPCMARNLCRRGCPFGAYFSSNAVTLPAAEATGNLTLRPHSVVRSILYDKERRRASGVRIVDTQTKETIDYKAKVVFLCASTLGSTSILLNSVKETFPDGLGNTSEQLGHNLMDNHFRVGANGSFEGLEDKYFKGRRPVGGFVPRFQNLDRKTRRKEYLRGFVLYGTGSRGGSRGEGADGFDFGGDYKDSLTEPGPWTFNFIGFGETLPDYKNNVSLDYDQLDPYGLPQLVLDVEFGENEAAMRKEMASSSAEMLEASGIKNIRTYDYGSEPGQSIHEKGTARMGKDPKTSVLNRWSQMHDISNIFVTDGSGMCSDSWGNPSLTYMALTARACDYAIKGIEERKYLTKSIMEIINRREALKRSSLILGTAISSSLVTGVMSSLAAQTDPQWQPLVLKPGQVKCVDDLTERILPATDTPGAKEAKVVRFIDQMVAEYLTEHENHTFFAGLELFEQKNFASRDATDQVKILNRLIQEARSQGEDSTFKAFFKLFRQMTVLGFFTSEVGATRVINYDPIPGGYRGCIPLAEVGGKRWAS